MGLKTAQLFLAQTGMKNSTTTGPKRTVEPRLHQGSRDPLVYGSTGRFQVVNGHAYPGFNFSREMASASTRLPEDGLVLVDPPIEPGRQVLKDLVRLQRPSARNQPMKAAPVEVTVLEARKPATSAPALPVKPQARRP